MIARRSVRWMLERGSVERIATMTGRDTMLAIVTDYHRGVTRRMENELRIAGEAIFGWMYENLTGPLPPDWRASFHSVLDEQAARLGLGPSASALVAACESGDTRAEVVLREAGAWLGKGLAVLTALLDPELFVIGGGVADAAAHYKFVGYSAAAAALFEKAGVALDEGFVRLDDAGAAAGFVTTCRKLRFWDRGAAKK